jgi:hypothetical protein
MRLITALLAVLALGAAPIPATEVFTYEFHDVKQLPTTQNDGHLQYSEVEIDLPDPTGEVKRIIVEVEQWHRYRRSHYNFSNIPGTVLTYDVFNALYVPATGARSIEQLPNLEVHLDPGEYYVSPWAGVTQKLRTSFRKVPENLTINNLSDWKHWSDTLVYLTKVDFYADIHVTVTYIY